MSEELTLEKALEIIRLEMISQSRVHEKAAATKASMFKVDGGMEHLCDAAEDLVISKFLEKMSKTFFMSTLLDWQSNQESRFGKIGDKT